MDSSFCLLLAFFLLCFVFFSHSQCMDLKDCFSKVRPGKLIGYTIKSFPNMGYHQCFNECFQHANVCRSFNYDKFTGLCELNKRKPFSQTLTDVTSFVNSLIPSAQPDDVCSPNPCSDSESCVVLSSGNKTCVKECIVDLRQSEAERLASDVQQYYRAGEEFFYPCNAPSTNVNRRVCLANGLWNRTLTFCSISCDFEETCPYLEHDSSNAFRRRSGPTPSEGTGCSSDHTNGNGSYYYMEASNMLMGASARMITSNPFPAGEAVCVGFWYHMYGEHMGSLAIEIKDNRGNVSSIEVASGSKGEKWNYWSTVIDAKPEDIWIGLQGVCGYHYKSDICIDDLTMNICESGIEKTVYLGK